MQTLEILSDSSGFNLLGASSYRGTEEILRNTYELFENN
jgi:hypothetical protein